MRTLTQKNQPLKKMGSLRPNTAHDLRNPIIGILTASQCLLDDVAEAGEERQVLLRAIQSSCESVLRLIDERMAEIESGLQNIDLVSLMRIHLASAVPLVERKGLKLALIIQGDVPLVQVDVPKMSLMFDRLLNNAVQFANPNSRLRILVEAKKHQIILSVRAGRAAHHKPAEKRLTPGSTESAGGKGLAVITKIIKDHGGQFKLNENLKKGSSLTVKLPVSQGFEHTTRRKNRSAPTGARLKGVG